MSRTEHHADSSDKKIKRVKKQIANILQIRDCREWAISSQGLADATGITASTVRDCIKEIRREQHIAVVSCSQGYYTISSVDELESELDRIQAEINTRKETKRELVAAFNHD
jgi:biotin operon repressor